MTSMSQVDEVAVELPPLPYAGIGLRIVAAILDGIVLCSVLLLFAAAAGFYLLLNTNWGADSDITDQQQWISTGIVAGFGLFLPWYFTALWWWRGQSLGQMTVHIAVTDRDGNHLSIWRAFLRTLLWPLSVLPLGLGLVPVFFDDEGRALHDMIAGTVVVDVS